MSSAFSGCMHRISWVPVPSAARHLGWLDDPRDRAFGRRNRASRVPRVRSPRATDIGLTAQGLSGAEENTVFSSVVFSFSLSGSCFLFLRAAESVALPLTTVVLCVLFRAFFFSAQRNPWPPTTSCFIYYIVVHMCVICSISTSHEIALSQHSTSNHDTLYEYDVCVRCCACAYHSDMCPAATVLLTFHMCSRAHFEGLPI